MTDHILSWVLFTPVIGMVILLFIPSEKKNWIRWWANIVAFIGFLISIPLVTNFDKNATSWQFLERADWIPSIGATYSIGIDGISLLLIMLTTLLTFISVLCSWSAVQDRLKEYYAMFLLLGTGMLGVFMSLDFFLFYVFWEI